MATQVKLGKGIASLIQDTPVAAQQAAIKAKLEEKPKKEMLADGNALMIDISSIRMNSHQPRKIFKEKELEELSESIKENGIIQPLIVIKDEDGFESGIRIGTNELTRLDMKESEMCIIANLIAAVLLKKEPIFSSSKIQKQSNALPLKKKYISSILQQN